MAGRFAISMKCANNSGNMYIRLKAIEMLFLGNHMRRFASTSMKPALVRAILNSAVDGGELTLEARA